MRQVGSQTRETLTEAGYTLISRQGKEVTLQDVVTGKQEVWYENNDFAGYAVEIDGKGYEFVHSL